ncbi:hypothetical protein [Escherichia coli]
MLFVLAGQGMKQQIKRRAISPPVFIAVFPTIQDLQDPHDQKDSY